MYVSKMLCLEIDLEVTSGEVVPANPDPNSTLFSLSGISPVYTGCAAGFILPGPGDVRLGM